MKKIILRLLYFLRIHRLMRFVYRNRVIILMYHGFIDKTQFDGIANYHRQNLHANKFRQQIRYLKNSYKIITLDKFIEDSKNGKQLPDNSIIITIDDGYKSNYKYAFPVLKEFNNPASIFLTTNFVDEKKPLWSDRIEFAINNTKMKSMEVEIAGEKLSLKLNDINSKITCDREIKARLKKIQQESRDEVVNKIERILGEELVINEKTDEFYEPLSWSEISEMRNSGLISFGSHTHSHFILTRCKSDNVKKELEISRKLIEEKTGVPCVSFCYPNGKPGDFDAETGKIIEETGYKCALTTVAGFNDGKSNRYELMRIGVGDESDMIEFIMKISGAMKFIIDIKKKITGK